MAQEWKQREEKYQQFPRRSATFRASPVHEGLTLTTDTVQIKLSKEDAKAVLLEAIRYLQIDVENINPANVAWLKDQED